MSLLVLQHVAHETPAELGVALQGVGHRLRYAQLFAGDPVPTSLHGVTGVISMGGPMNVDQVEEHPWIDHELALLKRAHDQGLPVLGICLGAQLIAKALGGEVGPMPTPEVGFRPVRLAFPGTTDTILTGQPYDSQCFHLHGQEVTELPAGAAPLAGSTACRHQAFKVGFRTYGFQYHFEWNLEQIQVMADDPLIEQAGSSRQAIMTQCAEHYRDYRRLGDRLAESIATYLFPVDRR